MRQTILALIKKEFLQVLRDFTMMRMIVVMPIIQMLVLGYAINTDVKYIYTAVYDFDKSRESRELTESFAAGEYFIPGDYGLDLMDAEEGFLERRFNAILVIPENFGDNLKGLKKAPVGFIVDGANANSATIALGYANLIAMQYNRQKMNIPEPIELRQKLLYNPEAESVYYMVPGIVSVLLTMITMMLTAMAIVREREIGTLEQLMVTPITVPALILGKTIPFAILGFLEMSIALAFGVLWFGIPFVGSWWLLYALALIFLFTTLGMGMFISTISSTQQQAMFLTWFFSIFALLTSGFFAPISNMPQSVQYLTYLNPLRYFMVIVRGIMMKGAGAGDLIPEIAAMVAFGTVIFTFSWIRLSKRVA